MEKAVKFKKIIFSSPQPRNSIPLTIILGTIYAFITVYFDLLSLNLGFIEYFAAITGTFVIPALIYSFITSKLIENFYRRRAYLLGLLNETLIFSGVLLSSVSGSLLIFVLGFTYSVNILSLMGVSSRKDLVPLLHPLVHFAPVSFLLYSSNILIFDIYSVSTLLFVTVGTLLSIHVIDYFFTLNISGVSSIDIFSGFLNKIPTAIDCGKKVNVVLQALNFETGDDFTVAIPYLHPGPLRYLGGGALSTSLIEKLNESGGGFFWHVPSSHEQDPSDPLVSDRIFERISEGDFEYHGSGTKVMRVEGEELEIYGQRFGDTYIFFIDAKDVDDFEPSIFRRIQDQVDKKVIFVDMHNHQHFGVSEDVLLQDMEKSEEISDSIFNLLETLEEAEEYEIRLGREVSEDENFMTLVEEIEDETYLLLAMDTNGISSQLKNRLENLKEGGKFDEVLLMTTDSHEDIAFLDGKEDVEYPSIKKSIDSCSKGLSKCDIGVLDEEIDGIKVLGKDSYHLEAAVNFVLHLFPVLISLIYLIFAFAVFSF